MTLYTDINTLIEELECSERVQNMHVLSEQNIHFDMNDHALSCLI